jgi:formylmethanofuran dehydrogenase subunit E
MPSDRIEPLFNAELVEVLCDECGETPLLVPAEAIDEYYWCKDCAADA